MLNISDQIEGEVGKGKSELDCFRGENKAKSSEQDVAKRVQQEEEPRKDADTFEDHRSYIVRVAFELE